MSELEQPAVAMEVDEDASVTPLLDGDIQVRSLTKREIDARIMPWDTPISTSDGLEEFRSGAFEGTDPSKVLLMGLEHEAHIGLGQNGQPVLTRRPTGKGIAIENRDDGAYMTFRVAKTAAGDEVLALAEDGIAGGVSVEFSELPTGTVTEMHNGRRKKVHHRAALSAVSTTYRPAYVGAQVLAVRSQHKEVPVTDDKAPVDGAPQDEAPTPAPRLEVVTQARSADDTALLAAMSQQFGKPMEALAARLERIEEHNRSDFQLPGVSAEKDDIGPGQWMTTALKILTGERIPDSQYRIVAELITTDNAGVVPDAFSDRMIGIIDPRRPFMATTERIPTPAAGMQLVVPKIVTRPNVARQAAEKDELASNTTSITTESFNVQTYGGVGDISIQLLKRSDPSFLELYLRLLAEAYAIETEDAAVSALITAVNDGGPEPASALNPSSLNLGAAFQTSFNAVRRGPDTIWMSSEAVAEFIDAKASGTNAPLYSNLSANFTAAGGVGGTIQGLRAVHVPSLDDKGAYAIVGPSNGFAWAEDGTYTLQVDVPSKAGRDVALVGMVWHIPWYPEAFSLFNVAS